MPAREVLPNVQGTKFDVVGHHGQTGPVVTHVGLLADAVTLDPNTDAEVFDMGPPIHVDATVTMKPSVMGSLPLTVDEAEIVAVWLEAMATQIESVEYVALPAWQEKLDPDTGRRQGWKFSCAGFVLCAYRAANVQLVDESALPLVSHSVVVDAWSHVLRGNRDPAALAPLFRRLGLVGAGPWNLLLPGYLVHALDVSRSQLPYTPTADDRAFPRDEVVVPESVH